MKKRNTILQKGFILRMIPAFFITFLLTVSFYSCREDETVLATNSEALTSQSSQLKSAAISVSTINALIVKIKVYVTNGVLDSGIANSLISKLENAKKSLANGSEKTAMNQLQSVINQLESLIGDGTIDSSVGKEIIFDTQVIAGMNPSFIDIRDNKEYKTVQIGDQVWMTENLAYKTATGSWAYDDDENNVATYGRLYTWEAALSACPAGWHLPSNAEWTTLVTYLGGESVAGGKLKEAGTGHWASPNTDATNETGFTALPGGFRDYDGTFRFIGIYGVWWFSSEFDANNAVYLNMYYLGGDDYRGVTNKQDGLSVRCLKD